MKIIVLVKEVPDTYGERHLNLETGLTERASSENVLDEIGERSIEAALTFREGAGHTEIVALTMGPSSAQTALRKALAMGADSAVHVCDDELIGADLTLTATVLAAAARHIGFDLVVCGNASTDGGAGVLPAMLSETLQVPQVTFLSTWELTTGSVTGTRVGDQGVVTVSAPLPAVVSITEAFPDARFPNFKGIMAAKKKPLETLSLADLQVSATPDTPRSILLDVARTPPRQSGTTITDEGDAGEKVAQFLLQNRLV